MRLFTSDTYRKRSIYNGPAQSVSTQLSEAGLVIKDGNLGYIERALNWLATENYTAENWAWAAAVGVTAAPLAKPSAGVSEWNACRDFAAAVIAKK